MQHSRYVAQCGGAHEKIFPHSVTLIKGRGFCGTLILGEVALRAGKNVPTDQNRKSVKVTLCKVGVFVLFCGSAWGNAILFVEIVCRL